MKGTDILILAGVGLGALYLFGFFTPAATSSSAVSTPATGTTTNTGTTSNAAAKAGTATNAPPGVQMGFIGGTFLNPLTGKPV